MVAALVLEGAAAGCGSDDDDDGAAQGGSSGSPGTDPASTEYGCRSTTDGTRLTAKMLAGDDGSRFFQGWLDSELGVECELALAADGVRRCVPTALAGSSGPASTLLTFIDPQCTQRAVVFFVDPCGRNDPASYAIWEEDVGSSDCPVRFSHVYELGERLDPFDTGYTLLEDGSCEPYDANENWNWTFDEPYRVGEELAPERFVSVEGLEAVGERLRDVRIDMSDGSSQYGGSTYDSELDAECRAVEHSDGTSSCVPWSAPRLFVDSGCSQLGVWERTSACVYNEVFAPLGTSQNYVVSAELDSCGVADDYRVYDSPEPDSPALAQGFDLAAVEPHECVAMELADGIVRAVGPELPHETFATGEMQTVSCGLGYIGGTRLRVRAMVWSDGWVDRPRFFDTEFGAPCSARLAADGVERCLPLGAVVRQELYADAQCSRQVVATTSCPEDATDYASRDIPTEDFPDCASTIRAVHRLTGPTLTEAYSLDDDGVCTLLAGTDVLVFRELGEEIDPMRFVAISGR